MGFRFDGRTRAAFLTISVLLSGQEPERALRPQQANASPAVQEARIALVIGNGAYRDAPLKNPVNDARAMAGALGALGFQVIALEDASLQRMREGLREFGSRIAKGGVGLFYYAGHGMQVKGRNYLIPVGADIQAEDEVAGAALDVDSVLAKLETARNRLNILILDACRNDPFARSFRSGSRGLAPLDAPTGTFIAFATAPGRTAADGSGNHGLYTEQLLQAIQAPGLKLEDTFKRVLSGVRRTSSDQQVPWTSSSVEGDFYFLPAQTTTISPLPSSQGEPLPVPEASLPLPSPEEAKLLDSLRGGPTSALVSLARKLAAQGSPYGRFALDWVSEGGPGGSEEALRQNARQGIPLAMAGLAYRLTKAPSPSAEELAEARSWLAKAERLGEPIAKFLRGQFLITGKLGVKNARQGEQLLREAVQQRPALCGMAGSLFWDEKDVRDSYAAAESDAKGLAFNRQGAELGDVDAMNRLGWAYFHGDHAPKDPGKALEWLLEAAKRGNDPSCFRMVGLFYRDVEYPQYQSGAEATRWFTLAAQKGDVLGWVQMAEMYRDGKVVPQDLPKAVELYTRAAEAPDDDWQAQLALGGMYQEGLGVPKDLQKACFWYVLSGQGQGDPPVELQNLELQGMAELPGAKRAAEAKALAWRRGRAERGLPASQGRLGMMYEKGIGVPPSLAQAYFWYLLAGDDRWSDRHRVGKQLSAGERARIESQASVWRPKP